MRQKTIETLYMCAKIDVDLYGHITMDTKLAFESKNVEIPTKYLQSRF